MSPNQVYKVRIQSYVLSAHLLVCEISNSFRFVAEDFGSGSEHPENEDVPPISFAGDEKDAAVIYFVPNLAVVLTYPLAVGWALADLHFRGSLSVTKRRLSVCCVSLDELMFDKYICIKI